MNIELGSLQPMETNCFGEDSLVDWSRSFIATDASVEPPEVIEGDVKYRAPDESYEHPRVMVGFQEVEEASGMTANQAFELVNDDEVIVGIIRDALPGIIGMQRVLRERFAHRRS